MEAMKGMQGPALMFAMLGCCITPFIISTTFMGLYWGLFSDAAKFNDESTSNLDNPFDACGTRDSTTNLGGVAVKTEQIDTKWTVVFTLNAVVYTLLSASTLCLFMGALLWPLAFCGLCGFICTQMAHFAAVIVTGVFRYSDEGEFCAGVTNLGINDKTMEDIGTTMEGLFISQCVLYCFYGFCLGCFAQIAFATAMLKRAGM